jgi:hypothetical protein
MDVLEQVSDDINCLYFHLRENVGQLFRGVVADDTAQHTSESEKGDQQGAKRKPESTMILE